MTNKPLPAPRAGRPTALRSQASKIALAVALGLSAGLSHAGLTWIEASDAGQLTTTAQTVVGSGAVDAIRGTLLTTSGTDRADLFAIFLTAGTPFTATTAASSLAFNNFDTTLFLFNSSGLGVLATDDTGGPQSTISGFTPALSGVYFIAIAGAGYNPISSGGSIFPASLFGGGQVGPTGAGGAFALSGWNSTTNQGDAYEILLTGASAIAPVPEPAGAALLALGLAGLARLKIRKHRARPGAAACSTESN